MADWCVWYSEERPHRVGSPARCTECNNPAIKGGFTNVVLSAIWPYGRGDETTQKIQSEKKQEAQLSQRYRAVLLTISLSHSRSLKVIRSDALE